MNPDPGMEPVDPTDREEFEVDEPFEVDEVLLEPHRRPRSRLLGVVSVLVAILAAILVAAGVSAAVDGEYAVSITVGWFAVGTSILGVLLGVAAVSLRAGRAWGVLGIVLSVLANPLTLLRLLGWLSGLG